MAPVPATTDIARRWSAAAVNAFNWREGEGQPGRDDEGNRYGEDEGQIMKINCGDLILGTTYRNSLRSALSVGWLVIRAAAASLEQCNMIDYCANLVGVGCGLRT